MKRILMSIVMLVSALNIFAEPDVKVRMGLQAGYNMSSWNGDFKEAYGGSFKHGFNAGVVAEIQLNSKWSIQPGLLFCSEGAKLDSLPFTSLPLEGSLGVNVPELEISGVSKDVKVGAMGLKFPVDIMYSIYNVGPGRLVPSLGLYVTGYFAGETLESGTFDQESVFQQNWEADIEQSKDLIPDQFDYGLSFKIMYEMMKEEVNGMYWQVGVSRGFTSCQNMVIMASFGYKFQYIKGLRSRYNTGILEYNP
jgi:hypothetical protein